LSTEPCTFELLDLKGSIMLKTTVNTSQNTVNLSRYDKGLYLYRISGKDGLLKAGKIVKN
ncbi:MAG: T9SS type A sorting domain-containing protein, partial [Paludibacter sp.]